MRLSVVTPCLNAEKYIAETVASIITQPGDFEIEYIVVDGASSDNTVPIVERYMDDIKQGRMEKRCREVRIKLISEKDGGIYDALAKGLKKVSGDVVAYLNSDDLYSRNCFKAVSDIFRSSPRINWFTGAQSFYNEHGVIIGSDWPLIYDNRYIQYGLYNNKALPCIQQESVFMRSTILEDIDFEKLVQFKYAGDAFMWKCFSTKHPLFVVSAILSGYRMHGENLAVVAREKYWHEVLAMSETPLLSEEDYLYIFYLHTSWWSQSRSFKEKDNSRYITWDIDGHGWRVDHLDFDIDYRLVMTENYSNYRLKPPNWALGYITKIIWGDSLPEEETLDHGGAGSGSKPLALRANNYSDGKVWRNGVNIDTSDSFFFAIDKQDLESVRKGDRLMFPMSGEAEITSVYRHENKENCSIVVKVDIKLDPLGDGYPHIIRLVR